MHRWRKRVYPALTFPKRPKDKRFKEGEIYRNDYHISNLSNVLVSKVLNVKIWQGVSLY